MDVYPHNIIWSMLKVTLQVVKCLCTLQTLNCFETFISPPPVFIPIVLYFSKASENQISSVFDTTNSQMW